MEPRAGGEYYVVTGFYVDLEGIWGKRPATRHPAAKRYTKPKEASS